MEERAARRVAYTTRIRGQVWAALAVTLALALVAPALTTWRETLAPLQAQAAIWPATPHAGAPARLVVALVSAADRAAVAGPWAQVEVVSDMTTMAMRTPTVVAHGPTTQGDPHADSFDIPLRLTMAGTWWVKATLQTPGRPAWQRTFAVTVLPATAGTGADAGTARTVTG